MLDRQKLEAILRRRFPEATHPQVAAAANAIMQLGEESQYGNGTAQARSELEAAEPKRVADHGY